MLPGSTPRHDSGDDDPCGPECRDEASGLARVDHLGPVEHQATAGHAIRYRTGPRTRGSRARPDGFPRHRQGT